MSIIYIMSIWGGFIGGTLDAKTPKKLPVDARRPRKKSPDARRLKIDPLDARYNVFVQDRSNIMP